MSNIIILMSDEHNPFYSSVYGNQVVQTPNMERLAAQGTVFENAYCNSPLCMPSRSSFMTGLPVHQLQTYNNCNVISHPHRSYGAILREQGVHTVHIGKTHVWNVADQLGFSEILLPKNGGRPGENQFRRTPIQPLKGSRKRAERFGPNEAAFATDIPLVDEAVRWLQQRQPGQSEPWTLCVNIRYPHFPHDVNEKLWNQYKGLEDLPVYGKKCETAQHPHFQNLRAFFETDYFTDEQIGAQRRSYWGCVSYVDGELGRILDTLQQTGHDQDTVCVYTSDHGEMLGKFGMWWKSTLLEDAVRIPLIAAGPGFAASKRIQTAVSLLDLNAAIYAAVEKQRPDECWGEALQSIPDNDNQRVVFSEYHGHGVSSGAFMVRKGRWKLIYCMEAPHLLFDLEADPHELHNLAEQRPDALKEMEQTLRELCSPEAENQRAIDFEQQQKTAMHEYIQSK